MKIVTRVVEWLLGDGVLTRQERAWEREKTEESKSTNGNLIDEDSVGGDGPQPLLGIPKIQELDEDW